MNVFIAGVHGVGKSYLASKLPKNSSLRHFSASKLIAEERAMSNWARDKRVSDIDSNQIALAAAVIRHNQEGVRLLLDGHFVLLDSEGSFTRLDSEVFRALNLSCVVLIEADPQAVVARIRERDQREVDLARTAEFLAAERAQAISVCDKLGISLRILDSPSPESFEDTIAVATQMTSRR